MVEQENWGELHEYRDRLRSYSGEELEDVFFNIHIVRHPLRYRLVMHELEARGMPIAPAAPDRPRRSPRAWLEEQAWLAGFQWLRFAIVAAVLTLLTAAATMLMLAPIWLFAVHLDFLDPITAAVYIACAPFSLLQGAAAGRKMGGHGGYAVCVALGVLIAGLLFWLTGTPTAIVHALTKPQGATGGGFSFG